MNYSDTGSGMTTAMNGGSAGDSRTWYALSVMSRQEFTTTAELKRKGVEVFLPTVKKVRQWSDRRKHVDFPLFPGYVFVQLGKRAGDYSGATSARGAVRLVSLEPGRPTPVAEGEIESLKRIVESGMAIEVYPGLRSGSHVRVRRGPLAGTTGVVGQQCGMDMFIINIDILGRSVGTKICAEDIEQA